MNRHGSLRLASLAILAVAGPLLSGCVSSPTYGTGVSANQQLVDDVSNILSIGPKKREKIDYRPRPELVKPAAPEQAAALPAPQQKLASADNPDWPEAPEARRARIRANATANQDNAFYEPEVASDGTAAQAKPRKRDIGFRGRESNMNNPADVGVRREAFNKRLAQSQQGSPTSRAYLSEPPLAYRQPADTAPTDDIGEDEWKKEKRLKAEARKKSGKTGWFDWLPGV